LVVDVSAATDKGECDGDVTVCDDVIGGGSDVIGGGAGPDRGPKEQSAAAEVMRPRLPAGDVR
jgi:hypothetical protein